MLLAAVLLLACASGVHAQAFIRGRLIDQATKAPLPDLTISNRQNGASAITNPDGAFKIAADRNGTAELQVLGLGIDTLVRIAQTASSVEIELLPKTYSIKTVTIQGATAQEVVARAIAKIPDNYPQIGCAYYGHYRQYHRIDSQYANLLEAQAIALVRPKLVKSAFETQYDFACISMRKQKYRPIPVEGIDETDGLTEVFAQDPVYNLERSVLTAARGCTYRFDTSVVDTARYHIQSHCTISGDFHGLDPGTEVFFGEGFEDRDLVIDRRSLAFVSIERRSYRNPSYHYANNRNFVLPHMRHTIEFLGGRLVLRYAQTTLGWVLDELGYAYTNEFFRTSISGSGHECALGQYFEWKTDSVRRTLPQALLPAFRKTPYLHLLEGGPAPYLPQHMPMTGLGAVDEVYRQAGWDDSK